MPSTKPFRIEVTVQICELNSQNWKEENGERAVERIDVVIQASDRQEALDFFSQRLGDLMDDDAVIPKHYQED